MSVNIVQVLGFKSGLPQRGDDGLHARKAVFSGRGKIPGVREIGVTRNFAKNGRAARKRPLARLQTQYRRPLRQHEPITVGTERTAGALRILRFFT